MNSAREGYSIYVYPSGGKKYAPVDDDGSAFDVGENDGGEH